MARGRAVAAGTRFETEPCGRCGGTGTYSYCPMWGTTCFDCGVRPGTPGTGRRLTKRGAAALAYYRSLLPTKLARDVAPGDKLRSRGFGVVTVTEIRPATGSASWTVDGVKHVLDASTGALDLVTDKVLLGTMAPDKAVDVLPTVAERDAALAAALAFEKTLTKLGKPRKRAAAAN